MAIRPISKLPDPIQPLSNDDYLMLSVFNPDSGGQLSVKCTLGQLKDYVMGGTEACEPTSVHISPNGDGALTSTPYTVTYKLADGLVSDPEQTTTITFTVESGDGSDVASLSNLLKAMADAIGLPYHGGGGGTAQWSLGYPSGDGLNMISGGDGSVTSLPQTLDLYLTPNALNDAVQVLFGSGVTVHSCGSQNYPGV